MDVKDDEGITDEDTHSETSLCQKSLSLIQKCFFHKDVLKAAAMAVHFRDEFSSFLFFPRRPMIKTVANRYDERIGYESVRTSTNEKYDDEKGGVDIRT